jgi:transposase
MMAKVTNYTRTRIECLHKQGLHPADIFRLLKAEGLLVSLASVVRIIKKLKITGSVANLPRSGRPSKMSEAAKAFIDQQMRKDDETTSRRIQKKLAKRGVVVSSTTVRRARKQLGWTLQRTGYCQLIRDVNKTKRLEFAQSVLESGDTFHNVIFSDESSISLTQYRRTCYRKIDEPAKRKPKPKHPLKVHVWAGISKHGATKICFFAFVYNKFSIFVRWQYL